MRGYAPSDGLSPSVFFGVFGARPQLFLGEEWEKITQAVEFQYFKKIKKNYQSDLQKRGMVLK